MVAFDFTVVPGPEARYSTGRAAKQNLVTLCTLCRTSKVSSQVLYAPIWIIYYLLEEKDDEVMMWLRWCAPKVKEMYASR